MISLVLNERDDPPMFEGRSIEIRIGHKGQTSRNEHENDIHIFMLGV